MRNRLFFASYGMMLVHSIVLWLIFKGAVPWSYALSIVIWPVLIFAVWRLSFSDWWKLHWGVHVDDDSDRVSLPHFIIGIISLAGVFFSLPGVCSCDVAATFLNRSLMVAAFSAAVGVFSLLLSRRVAIALYVAALPFFFMGLWGTLSNGISYYLVWFLPAVAVMLSAAWLSHSSVEEYLRGKKNFIVDTLRKKKEERAFIAEVLSLPGTPETKAAIRKAVNELRSLQKEMRKREKTIKTLSEIHDKAVECRYKAIPLHAKSDEVFSLATQAFKSDLSQKISETEALLREYERNQADSREKADALLKLLSDEKERMGLYEEYEEISREVRDMEKDSRKKIVEILK
jgi:predicted transcriptional regulator